MYSIAGLLFLLALNWLFWPVVRKELIEVVRVCVEVAVRKAREEALQESEETEYNRPRRFVEAEVHPRSVRRREPGSRWGRWGFRGEGFRVEVRVWQEEERRGGGSGEGILVSRVLDSETRNEIFIKQKSLETEKKTERKKRDEDNGMTPEFKLGKADSEPELQDFKVNIGDSSPVDSDHVKRNLQIALNSIKISAVDNDIDSKFTIGSDNLTLRLRPFSQRSYNPENIFPGSMLTGENDESDSESDTGTVNLSVYAFVKSKKNIDFGKSNVDADSNCSN